MGSSCDRHTVFIPLEGGELIAAVVLRTEQGKHVVPLLLHDRATIAYLNVVLLGVNTAAELMEAQVYSVRTRRDVLVIRNGDATERGVIDDGIAQLRRIEMNLQTVEHTCCDVEVQIELLVIGADEGLLSYRSLQTLVDRQGEVDRTVTAMRCLEHDEVVIQRLGIAYAVHRHASVRTDGVVDIGVSHVRIYREVQGRRGVTACKVRRIGGVSRIRLEPLAGEVHR